MDIEVRMISAAHTLYAQMTSGKYEKAKLVQNKRNKPTRRDVAFTLVWALEAVLMKARQQNRKPGEISVKMYVPTIYPVEKDKIELGELKDRARQLIPFFHSVTFVH
jgi:hypothetical protein